MHRIRCYLAISDNKAPELCLVSRRIHEEGVRIPISHCGYLLLLTAFGSLPINLSLRLRQEGKQGPKLRGRLTDGELERLFYLLIF
jgi:hypothetical protein